MPAKLQRVAAAERVRAQIAASRTATCDDVLLWGWGCVQRRYAQYVSDRTLDDATKSIRKFKTEAVCHARPTMVCVSENL